MTVLPSSRRGALEPDATPFSPGKLRTVTGTSRQTGLDRGDSPDLFSEFWEVVPGLPWLADSRESLIVSVMALRSRMAPRGFVRAHHQSGSIFDPGRESEAIVRGYYNGTKRQGRPIKRIALRIWMNSRYGAGAPSLTLFKGGSLDLILCFPVRHRTEKSPALPNSEGRGNRNSNSKPRQLQPRTEISLKLRTTRPPDVNRPKLICGRKRENRSTRSSWRRMTGLSGPARIS